MPQGINGMTSLCLMVAIAIGSQACDKAEGELQQGQYRSAPSAAETVANAPRGPLTEEERRLYTEIARDSWAYFEANYQPATGLVNSTRDWAFTTTWDIGSQMLAFRAAKELKLLTSGEYDRRMSRLLTTLERAGLFNRIAYNKSYSTRDGSMGNGVVKDGAGYSATDMGRLLISLKIIATRDPQFAAQVERIVRRMNFSEMVKGGYMHGSLLGRNGRPYVFQEGRIGYEQYMAVGFNLWGADVANSLDYTKNMVSTEKVFGVDIPVDGRWQDRLLSEPFYLLGLELGFSPAMRELSQRVLDAQEGRYKSTGQITIVTEDAVGIAPYYFYYYCVYCNRKPFVVDLAAVGRTLDEPRWVSTKGAFGWHAVLPSDYTRIATEHVARARDPRRGWASGVYERTGASTRTYDINTAAVLLEVAAFQLRGARPLIEPPAGASP